MYPQKFNTFKVLLFTSRKLESEVKTMEEAYEQQQEQINWVIITNQINENEVQEEYQPEFIRLEESILQKTEFHKRIKGEYTRNLCRSLCCIIRSDFAGIGR